MGHSGSRPTAPSRVGRKLFYNITDNRSTIQIWTVVCTSTDKHAMLDALRACSFRYFQKPSFKGTCVYEVHANIDQFLVFFGLCPFVREAHTGR